MLASPLRRAIIQSSSSSQSFILPPTFLLPFRAHLSTISNTTSPNPPSTAFHPLKPVPNSIKTPSPPSPLPASIQQAHLPSPVPAPTPQQPATTTTTTTTTTATSLLPLLAAQPPHYITAHLHARPYLLTAGDILRLPFHLPNAPPGTLLRLNRASTLGSRDYTLRGKPWIDERSFVCRMRVLGVDGEPMRVVEKTKRRQRHVKRVRSKMRFTVLRCVELRVLGEGNGEAEAGGRVVGSEKLFEMRLEE